MEWFLAAVPAAEASSDGFQPAMLIASAFISAVVGTVVSLVINALDRPRPQWEVIVDDPGWGFNVLDELHGPVTQIELTNIGAVTAHRLRILGFYCGKRENQIEGYDIISTFKPIVLPGQTVSGTYEVHSEHWDDAGILITWTRLGVPRSRMATDYRFIRLSDYADKPEVQRDVPTEISPGVYDSLPAELDETDVQYQTKRDQWLLDHAQVYARKESTRQDKKQWKRLSKLPGGKFR